MSMEHERMVNIQPEGCFFSVGFELEEVNNLQVTSSQTEHLHKEMNNFQR